jgi:hypothetical protein
MRSMAEASWLRSEAIAMDALGTLMRLARREVDEERRALAALEERRKALLDRFEELERDAVRESEAAEHLPGGSMLLLSYLAARRERAGALCRELEALEQRRLAQLERLAEKRLEAAARAARRAAPSGGETPRRAARCEGARRPGQRPRGAPPSALS